jgi:adenylyltransferase/sulfurtransferase
VLGVLPGIIGVIQATEAIKLVTGIGEPLIGRFLIYDALRMHFRELRLRKDPECPVCGLHPTVTKLIDYEEFCGFRPAEPEPVAAGGYAPVSGEISALELKQRLDRGDALTLVDVREPNEFQINRIPGAKLIPLGEVPRRYRELDAEDEIVVSCKVGARSARAADFLRSVGFKRVLNLHGGIVEWIDKVDPSQPRY